MSQPPDLSEVNALTQRLRRIGITQQELSNELCVSQSQISRVLGGKSGGRSKLLQQICSYASKAETAVTADQVRTNDELIGALTDIWDGSPEHAHALATVIRALGVLSRPAPRTRRRQHDRAALPTR